MTSRRDPSGRALTVIRLALAAFVVAWLLSPYSLRPLVPVWIPFLIALALEVQFFVGALRVPARTQRRVSGPQDVDRELYGYGGDADDLLLVREGGEELWIRYAGEEGEELDELIAAARAEDDEPPPPAATRRRAPARRLALGLALISVLAAVAWAVDSRSGWKGVDDDARREAVARFSTEASTIVGRPVAIRCDDSGAFVGAVQHADGVAEVGGRLAFLTPERCYDLYRLAEEGEVSFSQTARSLAVLAHEAWHLRGVRDEGATECYALQSAVALGVRFGLEEATARRMMRQQLAENSGRAGADAEYRVPADCRNGGTLDLNPGDSAFP